jgi:hypothetical protein
MKARPTYKDLERKIECLEAEAACRKNADEALFSNEEKYRTILAGMEDGYFEVDLKGSLTFYNPALCKVVGYSESELMGMNNSCWNTSCSVTGPFYIHLPLLSSLSTNRAGTLEAASGARHAGIRCSDSGRQQEAVMKETWFV